MKRGGVLLAAVCIAATACGLGAPPFEERFPDTVNGEPFAVEIVPALEAFGGGIGFPIDEAQLAELGVEAEDVRFAAGPPPEIGGRNDLSLSAYQFPGASEEGLAAVVRAVLESSGGVEAESRGGRDGWRSLGAFVYVRDDALYLLSGDDARIDEVVSAIP